MAVKMDMGNQDGWTWANILNTSAGLVEYAGVFVCLLQRNQVEESASCSRCASTDSVRLLCETILPLQRRPGLAWPLGEWKLLCSTCSIAMIDGWRKARSSGRDN